MFLFTHSGFTQPEWVFGSFPKPENPTYYYALGKGVGGGYTAARVEALSLVYYDAAMSHGIVINLKDIRSFLVQGDFASIKIPLKVCCEYEEKSNDETKVWILCQVAKKGNQAVDFTPYDCTSSKFLRRKDAKQERRKAYDASYNYLQVGPFLQHTQSNEFSEYNFESYGLTIQYGHYPDFGVGYGLEWYGSTTMDTKRWELGFSGLLFAGNKDFNGDFGLGLGYNFDFGTFTNMTIGFRFRFISLTYRISWYYTPKQPKNQFSKGAYRDELDSYDLAIQCYESGGFRKNIGGVVKDNTIESGWRPMYKAVLSHSLTLGFKIAGW